MDQLWTLTGAGIMLGIMVINIWAEVAVRLARTWVIVNVMSVGSISGFP